ncbi:unnamed protein product [Rotaria sordida]|uniref:Ubiquinone biosynthesis protein n=1 Tax=Rotaria sordida TaxID=392033 RepID=A0A814UM73_9BILA|nr:unnamed protein product [Rotaria sordida]CAF1434964.1 unnamed protein product [Rotaria sordida]
MQRLLYLRNGTSRLHRVVDLCYSNNNPSTVSNINILLLKRCLSNTNKDGKDINFNTELFKPSTAKEKTHVPDDLVGGQPRETIDSASKGTATLTGGGKVWSVQNSGSVHVAPLGAATTTFVPTSTEGGKTIHETTVHKKQGELNIADPLRTHILQPESTSAELAEAAAASAFEPFAPNTPLTTPSTTDTVFAPKISSTDVHSSTSSPTAQFESSIPPINPDQTVYETTKKSKVFGGQDTSASSKTHPKEDPFATKKNDKTSTTNEIPIQRESDLRDDVLRESLKYVNEHGWTIEAIRAGIRASNQSTTIEGMFSNGYDLIDYFMRDANSKMSAYMNEQKQKGDMKGSRLLVEGLKYRLGLVVPYANTWNQALAQGALPQNAMRSWKNLLDLSSEAWHGIGDTSTDMNWYSKRLLLAAVYKSAEIYMLQDQSQNKTDSMNFLERRLNDFQTLGSLQNSVSNSLSDTAQIVNGLFSVIRNLTSRR